VANGAALLKEHFPTIGISSLQNLGHGPNRKAETGKNHDGKQ
jgi:hypothetical protein